jgi:hypothetical protein
MNLHATDVRLEKASVEYLDDQLVILADQASIAITLLPAVVDEIRDELNTEYSVHPATEDALFVTRNRDNLTAVATSDIPDGMTGWGFTFVAHIKSHGLLGRFGDDSAIAAAKKAFAAYDASIELEAEAAS